MYKREQFKALSEMWSPRRGPCLGRVSALGGLSSCPIVLCASGTQRVFRSILWPYSVTPGWPLSPQPGLMLCCPCLEILNSWTSGPTFSFYIEFHKLLSCSCKCKTDVGYKYNSNNNHCHFKRSTEMTTHSSILAWRIPGMGKPGGQLSMGSHRVGHDWSDLAAACSKYSS